MVSSDVTLAPIGNITEGVPTWAIVLDNVQLSGAIIGIFANLATLVTLTVNGEDFSGIICMLFKYQSVLDCLCCFQATLLFTLKPMWSVGNIILDTLACQVWHSQLLYWLTVSLSIYNLVTLALERYICVCHALKYNLMTKGHFRAIITGLFFYSLIFLLPALFQTRIRDGQCRSEFFWDGPVTAQVFYAYAIISFFYAYVLPCTMFFLLYGLVILSFKKRAKKNLGASGTSAIIDKATSELTKTAIVVTIIFIISIGVDLWYYLLAYVGFVQYILGSPIQKIAVFFSVMNSVVNPFVYASFMPLYRKSVMATFFKSCTKG